MGYLEQNTYTITGLAFRILTCTVFKILNNLQGILNNLMCLNTLDIDNRTYTTVIVLKIRAVY